MISVHLYIIKYIRLCLTDELEKFFLDAHTSTSTSIKFIDRKLDRSSHSDNRTEVVCYQQIFDFHTTKLLRHMNVP